MTAPAVTATAARVLRQVVQHGSYGHAAGLFRPDTSKPGRGPGQWRAAGGRDAKAIQQLEAAGLITVHRVTVHAFSFRGVEYACRPTEAAVAALAALGEVANG